MTRQELEDALMAADAAGDEEGARIIAEEIQKIALPPGGGATDQPTQPAVRDPRAEYDALPAWQKPIVAASDIARIGGSSVGMGYAEKALAGIKSLVGPETYDQELASERQATADARARAGSAGKAAAVGAPVLAGTKIPSLMSSINPANLTALQRIIGGSAAGAIEGGVYGGIEASGNDRDIAEGSRTGAAFGGGAGGLTELLSSIGTRIANLRSTPGPAPTIDELADQSRNLRDEVADRGVTILPDTVADLNAKLRGNVGEGAPQGARPGSHPKTIAELDRLMEYSPSLQAPRQRASRTVSVADGNTRTTTSVNGSPPTTRDVDRLSRADVERRSTQYNMEPDRGMGLYDLDQHRRTARRNTRASTDSSDREMGRRVISEIDDFARSLDDTKAIAQKGSVPEAVGILEEARALDHRRLKAEEVGHLVKNAERSAEAASSVNAGNKVRGSVATFMKDPRNLEGYTPDELSMLEGIVQGTKAGDRWRKISEKSRGLTGGAIGGGAGAALGGMLGGYPLAAAGGATGAAASRVFADFAAGRSNKITEKQADELLDTILRGGGKHRQLPTKQPVSKAQKESFRRALMLLGLEDEQPE